MRKIWLVVLVLALLLVGFCSLSESSPMGGPTVWSQPADTSGDSYLSYFTAYPAYTIMVSDDWYRASSSPVISLHWWGVYSGWSGTSAPQDQMDTFHTVFYDNLGTQNPTTLLYEIHSDFQEEYYGSLASTNESIFQYNLNLTNHFDDSIGAPGSHYWLAIMAAYYSGTDHPWGWLTTNSSLSSDLANDSSNHAAVYLAEGSDWQSLYKEGQPVNMAFELGTEQTNPIPEPTTIVLLGSLATGLFGMTGLRRKFLRR